MHQASCYLSFPCTSIYIQPFISCPYMPPCSINFIGGHRCITDEPVVSACDRLVSNTPNALYLLLSHPFQLRSYHTLVHHLHHTQSYTFCTSIQYPFLSTPTPTSFLLSRLSYISHSMTLVPYTTRPFSILLLHYFVTLPLPVPTHPSCTANSGQMQ